MKTDTNDTRTRHQPTTPHTDRHHAMTPYTNQTHYKPHIAILHLYPIPSTITDIQRLYDPCSVSQDRATIHPTHDTMTDTNQRHQTTPKPQDRHHEKPYIAFYSLFYDFMKKMLALCQNL